MQWMRRRQELQSNLLLTCRVTSKEGKKTDYLQTYSEFSTKETYALKQLTESKADIIMMVSFDNQFAVYPDTEEAKKEVEKYKGHFRFPVLNRTMTKFSGYKISENMSAIEEDWSIDFAGKDQFVIVHKGNLIKGNPRKEEMVIAGKTFKKYNAKYFTLIVYHSKEEKLTLYVVDSVTGKILIEKLLTTNASRKVPLVTVYDNAIIIGLHYEDKNDEITLLELFIAPEVADNSDLASMQRASLEKLVYPIMTSVELKWKIYGLEFMQVDGIDYLATINDKNELKMMNIEKLTRGSNNKGDDDNTKEINLPKDIYFMAPITMEYNDKARTILLHGMDIYSYELN